MSRFPYFIMAAMAMSICCAPAFAQNTQSFVVKDVQSGQSFTVNYNTVGSTVSDMSLNTQDTSLVVDLKTSSDGNLTMTMPRTLIDAKSGSSDDQFIVLVDGADTEFTESKTDADRTISLSIPDGTQQVEVIGTQVIPEFGGLSFVVMVIAIISIIVISANTKLKFGLRS